ncbi:TolC family protein [Rubrivirga sp.]|uniref:TolC family protein n=1 Tax=Rubrivirga sp. TaxID=1885344 RepID=UPI003B5243E3
MRLLVLAALALAAPLQAQDTTAVTLAEAVALAVGQSPEVRRAEVADRGQALAVRAARASRLPTLDVQVSPQQRYGLGFDQTTGEVVSQTVETVSAGAFASVPLYDGGRARASIREAELSRQSAEAGLVRTRQQVALDVAQQFLTLLLDREIAEIEAEGLAAAQAQRARVAELVEAGARPRGDLIAQEAVVAERQTAFVVARGAVERDEVILIQLIGLDPLAPVRFVGPDLDRLEASGVLDAPLAPLAELLAAARETRADRRSQVLSIQAAEAAIGTARAASRPSVSLNANVGTGYSSLQQRTVGAVPSLPVTLDDGTPVLVGGQPLSFPGDPAFETTPVFGQFSDNRSGAIGVTLNVPIFDRYQARRGVVEAQIRADDARIQLDALDRQLASEVQQAVVEARTARARLDAAETQVEAATEALRVERDRYQLGAGTLYDVAAAQTRLAEAQAGQAQAAYGLAFRRVLVRLAVGDVDPSALAGMLE